MVYVCLGNLGILYYMYAKSQLATQAATMTLHIISQRPLGGVEPHIQAHPVTSSVSVCLWHIVDQAKSDASDIQSNVGGPRAHPNRCASPSMWDRVQTSRPRPETLLPGLPSAQSIHQVFLHVTPEGVMSRVLEVVNATVPSSLK